MSQQNIAQYIEAALLRPDATEEQVRAFCNTARERGYGAVCVNPTWVELAANVVAGSAVRVVSVASFPFGAGVQSAKSTEARLCLEHGATEVNMVLNIGSLKGGGQGQVQREIAYVLRAVKNVDSKALLKVVVECPLLSTAEKTLAGQLVAAVGADFIVSGSGFAGATSAEDISILRAAAPRVPICAEGATTPQQAAEFLQAGATRLSSSVPERLIGG